jgi:hypothetical protein
MENKIRKFIDDNELSFNEGCRNTTVTILIGYTQHLGLTQTNLEADLELEIDADSFIETEIERLWNYCKSNNYAKFWITDEAKELYKF